MSSMAWMMMEKEGKLVSFRFKSIVCQHLELYHGTSEQSYCHLDFVQLETTQIHECVIYEKDPQHVMTQVHASQADCVMLTA
jgi:hypothetical protein